ncbi:MAG: hypothetical protein PHC34_03065 [Candidatus Gastranaerophilales bacterium]|nr:hypothetical protein [Candidatus Gastranaerophilales bacterium]
MKKQEIYKLPTIEIEGRDDLIEFLSKNLPDCIFEYIEEVNNPVGKQWDYILTAKVTSDCFEVAILEYKESLWEKPCNKEGIIALWLKEAIPSINYWYKGKIKP